MAGDVKASKRELSTVIREMRMTFLQRLTFSQTRAIAGYMYSNNVLIQAELEQIQAEQTATNAASCLLDYVEKKGASVAGAFLTALQSPHVGLDDLAKKIYQQAAHPLHSAKLHNEQPQADISLPTPPTELKRKFRRARTDLINQLDLAAVMHIVDELYSQEKICEAEKQKIESHQTLQFTARSLIDVVDSRGDDVIRLFLEALKSEHIRRADLAQKVEEIKLN